MRVTCCFLLVLYALNPDVKCATRLLLSNKKENTETQRASDLYALLPVWLRDVRCWLWRRYESGVASDERR